MNLVIYLVGITILMAINIILSSFFYKRGISVIIEGEGKTARRKVNKELVYTSSGLKYSLIKRNKTLVNTPMMLVNSLMGVILGPILIIFTAKRALTLWAIRTQEDIFTASDLFRISFP